MATSNCSRVGRVPGTRPTREQLMVAIALADQVGAALGGTPAVR